MPNTPISRRTRLWRFALFIIAISIAGEIASLLSAGMNWWLRYGMHFVAAWITLVIIFWLFGADFLQLRANLPDD